MAFCGALTSADVRVCECRAIFCLKTFLSLSFHGLPPPPLLSAACRIDPRLPLKHLKLLLHQELNAFLPHRYNVSCSQHFKSSRGRTGAAPAPPPAPTESTVKRRGPPRRSTSSNASNKISSRHQLVKVWKPAAHQLSKGISNYGVRRASPCFFSFLSTSVLFFFGTQCNSESSRSEDVSSDGEEEDDSSSLSPSSSLSCSKAGQNAPPDSPAPCNQIEGSSFLSATPAQWSVEEVCRFISSLQGKLAGRPAPPLSPV